MPDWLRISLFVVCLFWSPPPVISAADGVDRSARAPVWIAFGDSLTASTQFTPPEGPWHQIVARHFGVEVVNAGVPGDSTERAFGRLLPDVLARHPTLVFMMFGINDQMIYDGAARGAYRVPPPQFAWNLNTMVSALRQDGARVVLLTNRPLVQGPGTGGARYFLDRHGGGGDRYPTPAATRDSIRQYNGIIRQIARHNGALLVDVWQAVVDKGGGDHDPHVLAAGIDRPGPDNDGVHLGPEGHRLIADLVIRELEKAGT